MYDPSVLGCGVFHWMWDERRTIGSGRAWARFSGGSLVCKMLIKEHLWDHLTEIGRSRKQDGQWEKLSLKTT